MTKLLVAAAAIIALVLSGCAPLFIAAGVEIEHDEWCRSHQTDWHCR